MPVRTSQCDFSSHLFSPHPTIEWRPIQTDGRSRLSLSLSFFLCPIRGSQKISFSKRARKLPHPCFIPASVKEIRQRFRERKKCRTQVERLWLDKSAARFSGQSPWSGAGTVSPQEAISKSRAKSVLRLSRRREGQKLRGRQDSNLQSSDPKSDALSVRPRPRHVYQGRRRSPHYRCWPARK